MNPKKSQEVLKDTCDEISLDSEFVSALLNAYWKKARREISEINKTRIELHGIGCFDLKYFKVKYKLRDTKAFIRYHQKSNNPRSAAILQNLNRKLEILERANLLSEKRAHDSVKKRNQRKQYILQNTNSLEE